MTKNLDSGDKINYEIEQTHERFMGRIGNPKGEPLLEVNLVEPY